MKRSKKKLSMEEFHGRGSMEKEVEDIHRIIDTRDKAPFVLPKGFDPKLCPDEERRMSRQYAALMNDLERRGFHISIDERMPLSVRFQYASHVAFLTEGLEMPARHLIFFNSCGAGCMDCFQAPWCDVEEIDDDGMLENALAPELDPFRNKAV
jgi:hypothetical protein